MWRLVSLASLLLMLALGTPADAKCGVCVESIRAENAGGLVLRITARSHDASALPPTGTAVLMKFNGERSKCANVTLQKIDESRGVGTYTGSLPGFYGGSGVFTGRLDIGGNVHDFSLPLNGDPGTVTLVDVAAPAAVAATAAPAASVPQQAAQVQPAAARTDTATIDLGALAQQPLVMIGFALAAIALMVFGERRRVLGRASN